MRRSAWERILLAGALIFALPAAAALAQVGVDTFAAAQGPVTLSSAPGSITDFVSGGGILQSERNLRVSGSSVAGGAITATVAGGQLSVVRPAGSVGQVDLWWDGANGASFSSTGLGGVDFTAGGATGFAVQSVASSSTTLQLQLVVYSGSDVSRIFFTLPAGAAIVELPFNEFELFGGAGADFANAGAIFLYTSDNTGGWSFTLTDLRLELLATIFRDGFETTTVCRWSIALGGPACS